MYLDYFFYICLLKSVNKKSKVVEHIQKAAKMNPNLFQSSGLLNVFYFFFALFFLPIRNYQPIRNFSPKVSNWFRYGNCLSNYLVPFQSNFIMPS